MSHNQSEVSARAGDSSTRGDEKLVNSMVDRLDILAIRDDQNGVDGAIHSLPGYDADDEWSGYKAPYCSSEAEEDYFSVDSESYDKLPSSKKDDSSSKEDKSDGTKSKHGAEKKTDSLPGHQIKVGRHRSEQNHAPINKQEVKDPQSTNRPLGSQSNPANSSQARTQGTQIPDEVSHAINWMKEQTNMLNQETERIHTQTRDLLRRTRGLDHVHLARQSTDLLRFALALMDDARAWPGEDSDLP
ncbi:hypothetical protein QQZ08_000493 [Neonectria magnoliae]|uniref:Uncharacterized protein n=1 Tax=Neonectria magnoliae TaxID=2732573 RepID=A0ABR1IHA8_9HYPO